MRNPNFQAGQGCVAFLCVPTNGCIAGPCCEAPAQACLLTAVSPSSSDYGFERSPSSESDANKCFADFWFNPLSPPDDCVLGQTYTSSLGCLILMFHR